MDPDQPPEAPPPGDEPPEPKKPWPMSWVVIAILAYVLFQMTYILFKGVE